MEMLFCYEPLVASGRVVIGPESSANYSADAIKLCAVEYVAVIRSREFFPLKGRYMKAFLIGALLTRAALADVVTDWNGILLTTINAEPAQAQSRYAAIMHLAVFEGVNVITRDYEPYLRTISAAPGASAEAAAIAAAHQVLSNYFPGRAGILEADRVSSLSAIPDSPAKAAGIAAGDKQRPRQ